MGRKLLTMMFFHFQDLKVHYNCFDLIEIADLMAARFDQSLMIYCKFLHFLPAIDSSRR